MQNLRQVLAIQIKEKVVRVAWACVAGHRPVVVVHVLGKLLIKKETATVAVRIAVPPLQYRKFLNRHSMIAKTGKAP